uniref:Regulator of microtubule dynamics protein 1 n=1 Tax=Aceria tosichella TaxID=561515 RepID=A0A6G1S7J0_9ACAR
MLAWFKTGRLIISRSNFRLCTTLRSEQSREIFKFTKNLRAIETRLPSRIQNRLNFGGIAFAVLTISMSQGDSIKGVSFDVLKEADKLFDESKFEELLEFLQKQPNWESNEQVLWRVARCEYQLAKKSEKDKNKYAELVNKAYDHVTKSLELDDKNGLAHKWAAILLDATSTLKGTKERVLQVLNVRNHMEKAVEYAPTDATSYYLLGEWHFSCYQVSWWERKLANIAFGKLPDADMEVALKMFEKAEEVEKDFYSKNKLMLAKTLLELKRDKERAINLLDEIVAKYSSSDKWDDKDAVEEANKLLKQHK